MKNKNHLTRYMNSRTTKYGSLKDSHKGQNIHPESSSITKPLTRKKSFDRGLNLLSESKSSER